ncbi:MAG: serine/threonine protein kinase [Betaproteobacteria bacterium]|nr:serine/threonine protein kinase [Betaproteobacteria bacterium]
MAEAADPKRIGRYDIIGALGEGAMGVVYEGQDTRLQRKVAIKTILKSALDSDSAKEYSTRFRRKARAVARLNHPNIVQVFDYAEEGEVAYIVMEFVEGRELKHFFRAKERFELKEVIHIMGELCDALHFAHDAGIIHRDIKPANVMIDSKGRVKLTDFGVARITDLERTVSERTQAGTILGTPAYMSPEQVQGQPLDRRTDIFPPASSCTSS